MFVGKLQNGAFFDKLSDVGLWLPLPRFPIYQGTTMVRNTVVHRGSPPAQSPQCTAGFHRASSRSGFETLGKLLLPTRSSTAT